MTDEAALQALLDAKPDDWTTRSILADLLEEQGRDDEAACQRWMAAWKKAPTRHGNPERFIYRHSPIIPFQSRKDAEATFWQAVKFSGYQNEPPPPEQGDLFKAASPRPAPAPIAAGGSAP